MVTQHLQKPKGLGSYLSVKERRSTLRPHRQLRTNHQLKQPRRKKRPTKRKSCLPGQKSMASRYTSMSPIFSTTMSHTTRISIVAHPANEAWPFSVNSDAKNPPVEITGPRVFAPPSWNSHNPAWPTAPPSTRRGADVAATLRSRSWIWSRTRAGSSGCWISGQATERRSSH